MKLKFSICVEQVFRGHDLYESLERLGEAGITDIEFTFWMDKDYDRLLALKEKYGFSYLGICPRQDSSMADPKRRGEYLKNLRDVIAAAERLGCKSIVLQAGSENPDYSEGAQYENLCGILREALLRTEESGLVVLLEPRNYYALPDTFLGDSKRGFEIVRQIGSERLRLLYDIYHMQLSEGNVTGRILENLPLVGHIHAAGIKDRRELPEGELNYDWIFRELSAAGYSGYVGLEYHSGHSDPMPGVLRVIREHIYR